MFGCKIHSEEFVPLVEGAMPRILSLTICSRMMNFNPCCCGEGDCSINDVKNDSISLFTAEKFSLETD